MSALAALWSLVSYIWPFFFVLSLVVFFHELGHFLIGRFCRVKVEAFSLGFGPELFGFDDRHGTHWRVAALPLGGYVKFHGETQEAPARDGAAAALTAEERAASFFAQKVWKRAAIVAAGPLANFVLAIAIYTGVFYVHGRAILLPIIDSVAADSAAEAAGFLPGDRIISIDGTKIGSFEDMQRIVQAASDTPLSFVVARGGKTVELAATPRRRDLETRFGSERVAVIGVKPKVAPQNWRLKTYGFFDSAKLAGSETWYAVTRTGAYLEGLISGQQPADELSGPIRIAEVSGAMAKKGFVALLHLTALLSISIGMLNLLPVPLLDGGHLAYYAIEALRGKAVDERVQQFGINVGIVLLASLMVFVTYNDILQLIRHPAPPAAHSFGVTPTGR